MRRAAWGLSTAFVLSLVAIGQRSSEGQSMMYVENVTFSVHTGQSSFGGPVSEVYILLDHYGGLNSLNNAKRLTNMGGDFWSIVIPLQEGDYIYTFCANPTQYVNLADPNLNPDDVPHANFFNDPTPRFTGYGGQYSTDNVYYVRDPNRPAIDGTMSSPQPGAEVTTAPLQLNFRVNLGQNMRPIDGTTAKVQIETNEVYGLTKGPLTAPAITLAAADQVTFTADANGGVINATINDPPDGLHVVHVDVQTLDQYGARTLLLPIYVNRHNHPPTADAGPTRFGQTGHYIEVDGGSSRDPDGIGFSNFAWRKVSGPGNMQTRFIGQEANNQNPGQRRPDGVPLLDGDGLAIADPLPGSGAVPALNFDQPGDYVVGLIATDKDGAQSQEATTTVHVAANLDASMKLRLHVGKANGKVMVSARDSNLPANTVVHWYADDLTPATIRPVDGTGLDAEIVSPQPGTYVVHAQAGDLNTNASYPADAIVNVRADGSVEGKDEARTDPFWRDDAVLYLLFVRQFYSSSGGSSGDLKGAAERIGWMKNLGVNAIWVMPLEPSGTTAGYSMDSFFAIHPDYGSYDDLKAFIRRAHDAGIKVILDNVLNHTSVKHPWFDMAHTNPNSVTRDRYYFRPDGSYMYAFIFVGLPDLNYNNPIVRTAAYDRADFWLDAGFDGFRCDLAGFTPNSVWRRERRQVLSRSIHNAMLAEMIPPIQEYIEEQFDMFYDPQTYWNMRDAFAGNSAFSNMDGALKSAETYVQQAGRPELQARLDPPDLVRMRYLDNQDEDRFLLKAGGKVELQKVAAAVQLTLPGMPLVNYGDEVAAVQGRGRMNFTRNPDMTAHYRKYIRIRNGNPGLRGQSTDNYPNPGNSYIRISSDNDLNAGQVLSFLRHHANQVFVVLANRGQSSVIGTPATFYVGQDVIANLPDPLVLTNHAQPTDTLQVTKQQLASGYTAHIGSYEVKVYQVSNIAIPDADNDGILDSYDSCVGVPNGDDQDDDFDGVANACDHCPTSAPLSDIGVDGCDRMSGAPKASYQLEGTVDDEAFKIADNQGIKLYASFNGKQLYVAMTGAKAGYDHVIYYRDPSTNEPLQMAAFQKAGQAAAGWAMFDQGKGDAMSWSGPWVGTRIAASSPLEDGVVESTINLVERYGSNFPAKIQLAAVRYGEGSGGHVMAQAPQATTADDNITPDEFVDFPLTVPTITPAGNMMMGGQDAGSMPQGGYDGSVRPMGSTDGGAPAGPCPTAIGKDSDGDGVDDGCDLCPNTPKGTQVDAHGCPIPTGQPPGSAFDNGRSPTQVLGCSCSALGHEGGRGRGTAWSFLAVMLAVAVFRRFRPLRWAALFLAGAGAACGGGFDATPPPANTRLITGKLNPPDPRIFQRQPIALELVGASLDARAADPLLAFYPGTPVSPSANGRDPVTVNLLLPQDRAVVMFFQVPTAGAGEVGQLLAPLRFPKYSAGACPTNMTGVLTDVLNGKLPTSNLPLKDIDLGVMDITVATGPTSDMVCTGSACQRTYQVLLGLDGHSVNPLKINDISGTGTDDFDNLDKNGNFIPDCQEADGNGDGIPDDKESLSALDDTDGDGPDRFEGADTTSK